MKLSELYDLDIYADNGQYLGKAKDIIVNMEQGVLDRILMKEWRSISRSEVREFLKTKSILFKNVKSVGDVILVSNNSSASAPQELQSQNDQKEYDNVAKDLYQ
ncbi:MAG: hypothetical protein ARM1_0355 [Candidatus Micrarchaeota archaeon]|nr:MAG: hypothetical protein ARM1_0355 [Candidatus Micrarchaeota archaeon]